MSNIDEFTELEAIIAEWTSEAGEVSRAIKTIKEKELYLHSHNTFDDWLEERFCASGPAKLHEAQHNLVLAVVQLREALDELEAGLKK